MARIRPGLAHHPIETSLSSADNHVCLNHWLPPRAGVVPKIRIGRHWINVLWPYLASCYSLSAWPSPRNYDNFQQ